MWKWIAGIFTFSEDLSVSDEGRRRYQSENGHPGSESQEVYNPGLETVVAWSFIARRVPWCLSVQSLRDDESNVLSISWGDFSTVVLGPTERASRFMGPNEQQGDVGLSTMLRPDALLQIRPLARTFSLTEKEVGLNKLPALVTLSTTTYEAEMSDELGVLLSWTAVIDGQVAVERRIKVLGAEREP